MGIHIGIMCRADVRIHSPTRREAHVRLDRWRSPGIQYKPQKLCNPDYGDPDRYP